MQALTNFHNLAKEQFWGKQKNILLPQTDKIAELQNRIYRQENSGIGAQIAKGALVLGGTVCSSFAAFALFGKKMVELEPNNSLMTGRIGRQLLSVPEIKSSLPPVSIFPTNPMPVTVISLFNLFFDPDGQTLALDIQSIPSWMVLGSSTSDLIGAYDTLDYASVVYVAENVAYIVDFGSGLQIVDVTNPNSPTLKGTYDTPGYPRGVHVVGNLAYVADDYCGLQIIDVSNPSFPTLKGTYDTPGTALGVYVVGNMAYVADYGSGLTIIDVSNSSLPILIGTYPGSASHVYIVGNLAYVIDGIRDLKIIDVSIPSSPMLKGNCDIPGSRYGVHVVGNFAYVANGASGLRIIDVSNSSSPTLKGTYDTPDNVYGVYVVGNLAYVADYSSGLKMIDVSNPSSPILKGVYNTPGLAYGVHVVGNLVYVADYDRGLTIIESRYTLTGTPNQTQVGNYEIELIAEDSDQNQSSQTLLVRVEGSPVRSGVLSNQLINVGSSFTYFIDQSVFSDPNNDIIFYSAKLADQNPLPSWLSFSSIGIFSGSPTSRDVGAYTIKVLAFDGIAPQQAETTFSLVVDHFPKVAAAIPDQAADIGTLYNYTIPVGTFTDADAQDSLTYTATLSNGDPLPSWLSFNGFTVSGTPSSANAGPLILQLSARDQAFATAQTSFTLTVQHFPDLVNPIPNQLAIIGQAFNFLIPSNTYIDIDGDALSLKATKNDGTILPFWLGFNVLRQEFQGTPFASDKGVLGLKVIAEDPKGGKAMTTFNLNIADSLGEEVVRVGGSFLYIVPNDMIGNPLGPVTYTVTLGSDSPLPTWMAFDPVTAVISGTPPSDSQGDYTFLITANDFVQAKAFGTLNLRVDTNGAPQVANFISNQVAQVNQQYRFVVPDNTFMDPNGDSLILSALKANNQPLPNWLKFDAATRTLTGKPARGDTGAFKDKTVPLQICASDGETQACSIFDLSVQGTSTQERTLSIIGPLGGIGAAGVAWYKKRGVFINPFNKSNYDKGTKIVPIGQPFTYKLEVEINKVKLVKAFKGKRTIAGMPVPKSLDERGWCDWLKHDKAIRGGHLLPVWLQYDEEKKQLTTRFNPREKDAGLYVVRAYGHGGVILEEIKLDVGGEGKNIEMGEFS